jgi:integrase
MPKSTPRPKRRKAVKPSSDFPLWLHPSGRWAKKVRQRVHYFGKADDPQGALERWLEVKDDLLAGREPSTNKDELRIADLVNHFLTHKKQQQESGELSPRTFQRYHATCAFLVDVLGRNTTAVRLTAAEFQRVRTAMTKRWGPVSVSNEIQMVRSIFRYGYEAGLLEVPPRFGPSFKKPSAKVLREARAKRGLRMFERDELLAVLNHVGVNLKAMALLGINGALGNLDVGLLPIEAVNLKTRWLDYPRPKTAIDRHIPLWVETQEAIRAALAKRRAPTDSDDSHLLFIGPRGESYVGNHRGYRVAAEMTRALDKADVNRKGLSFYALRHTFQTIGEDSGDVVAVQSIMGHAPGNSDMASVYRERISDERLKAVTDHVHKWLFGSEEGGQDMDCEVTERGGSAPK